VSVTGLANVEVETCQLCPRKYVAAVCSSGWYIGCIVAHNDDILIKSYGKKRTRYFDIFMATK
jgi:hypothetical protein